jgi:hypothetical protein
MDWFNELFENIDDMFADSKQVKFNTHKNRKAFVSRLKAVIKQAVDENTNPQKAAPIRASTACITRPNSKEPMGFAVMTENESSQNDEIHKAMPKLPKPQSNSAHQPGMRKW